ncbi:sorting nexin-41 [Kwoniella shandongensis]|uniref:Sorting nexin-41 n=1 Tax=Kwoniella shandongensis TaxID=1734106 RepID=A0A5M6BZY7_9TREE|nr:sorting nexin-41 [Kwoniella shandongensis]KAA5528447.1 sorting nexin-41 [Kwoniella shandongensis]
MDYSTSPPPNPFSNSPSPAPTPNSRPTSPSPALPPSSIASPSPVPSHARKSSSLISAASGSPPPTHRASFPDPSKLPKSGLTIGGPKAKEGYCCERDKEISLGEEVHIVDAFKTTEGGKASYITYVIRLGSNTTRRRYSAFLSLHQALTGLYPVLIIPPIPSKQSLTDYAVKGQSKAKEDATVIARRKRLLEDFLRRLIRHPILGGEHVLHRFLEDGVSWSEVLHSPPISLLPKNPLHAPSHNPTFQPPSPTSPSESTASSTSYIAHHLLPTPSPNHPLRQPDQRFLDSEVFTEKFQNHFSGTMEKVNRRVTKRWGERAQDLRELGAVWNGFSLVEQGKLGLAIERVGQAVDAEYLATAALLQGWERTTTEPLHIYSQFAALIRQRLSFRHQKQVQYELVQDALETQKDKLELLENAEREARRLEEALERGGQGLVAPPPPSEEERERAARARARAAGQGFGLLSAVKHSLSGMMDVDPEATRRANIGKTRDNISQLEDSLQASTQDLKYASMTLQADLDRFQRQKVADLKQMTIQLVKVHREWCRQNLEAWQAARDAIGEIDPHPNQPPASAQPAGPSTLDEGMSLGGMRAEIDRVEAANVPLPLPARDEELVEGKGKGKGKAESEDPVPSVEKSATSPPASGAGPLGPL